jgi:O-antigen/teichoic acid export membrane protein
VTSPFTAIPALLRRWGGRSILSVLDQGVFSASNFLLSLLLARWLAPGEYGGYAVAFSIFLFAAGFQNALILDPMYVLGSSQRHEEERRYIGTLVWLHFGLAAIMSAAFAGAASVLLALRSSLAGSMFSLAIASPLILLFWLFRAACYLQTRPDLALRGSLAYGIILLGLLVLLARTRHVSAFAAFLCMAAASSGGVALLFSSLGMRGQDIAWSTARVRLKAVMSENWRYGRWVTGSTVLSWVNGAIYLPLLGLFGGLAQAGAFQALQNLIRPLQQTFTSLGVLFLPHLSRQRTEQAKGNFRRTVGRIIAVNVAISVAYLLPLLFAREWIIAFLYRRSYYGEFTALIPLLWLAAILGGVTQGLSIGLKSVQRSDLLFWVYALGAFAAVTLGLVFVRSLKIEGAAIGYAMSFLVLAAGNFAVFLPYLRGRK